ncbi:MAG: 50S ribosomal protein L17 [Akkermansia sp.]
MRHGQKTPKLQRNASHRRALLANMAVSLIEHGRLTTTLAKAKALRPYVEKLITFAKRGDIHARRQVIATIHSMKAVKRLFADIAPLCTTRQGGYCRIIKLGQRMSDSALVGMIEIIDVQDDKAAKAAAEATATVATPATTTATATTTEPANA